MNENEKKEPRPFDPNDPLLTSTPTELKEARKGKGLGIVRMNNLLIIILGAVGIAFACAWLWSNFSLQKSKEVEAEKSAPKVQSTEQYVNNMLADQKRSGLVRPDPKPVPVNPKGAGLTTDTPPAPPMQPRQVAREVSPAPVRPQMSEEQRQLRQSRYQLFSQAVNSQTNVPLSENGSRLSLSGSGRSVTAPGIDNDITREYNRKLADAQRQLKAIQSGGGIGGASSGDMRLLTGGSNIQSAVDNRVPNESEWTLDSQVATPSSPYELKTGFVLPATMVTGINSDLPGKIIAQVSQNVYDTATGKHLLIPQGTRLWGTYSSNVAFGQERVLVAWNRLVFPDGKSLDIGEMPGATGAGYSGFKDKVNNHYFRLFGSALLMSAIVGGISYSQDRNNDNYDNSTSASDAMSEALGQQLGQVTIQLIQRHLNVAPTLEIRPGFRFNVIVTKDIVFNRPYQSFDY